MESTLERDHYLMETIGGIDNIIKNDNSKDKSVLEIHWENFKLFCNELYELLLDDFNNFLNFLTANKQYFIYGVLLVILSQIVSINSLGESVRKYCKEGIKQNGGAAQALSAEQQKMELFTKVREAKIEAKSTKMLAKSEMDKNKERISFFQKMKQKFQPGGWFGRFGSLGPVFGNLEAIMDSVKWIFAFFAVVAIIVGALSLPVIIFMVVTYFVIKSLLRKFTVL